MSLIITVLYTIAALLAAAFAFVELRMLWRFLTNRVVIRAAGDLPNLVPPTVTIQIPLYNERTTAEQVVTAAATQDYPKDRPRHPGARVVGEVTTFTGSAGIWPRHSSRWPRAWPDAEPP